MIKLIGLCGYKGAGKSTVSEAAINLHGAMLPRIQRIGFADIMVEMIITMGIDRETMRDKSKWDDPQEILGGCSIRHAVRTLGTDWGREEIHIDVWTNLTIARALAFDGVTIIDNVRFLEEAETIINNGGSIVAFHRQEIANDGHESESYINGIQIQYCLSSFQNKGVDLATDALHFADFLQRLIHSDG